MSVTVLGLGTLVGLYLLALALGTAALVGALAYVLGWAVAGILASARALLVPLVDCATPQLARLLSRRNAGRTAVPRAGQVSRTGHPAPALDEDDPPAVTSTPAVEQPPGYPWVSLDELLEERRRDGGVDAARRLWLNSWTAEADR